MASKNFFLLEKKSSRSASKNNKNKIILNTRVRVARNLTDHKFTSVSNSKEKNAVLNIIKKCVADIKEIKGFRFYLIKKMAKIQRDSLFEDYLISPEMTSKMQGKGLFIKTEPVLWKSSSIIVNQEDHLQIQSVYPSLNILDAYCNVVKVEKELERELSFAFSKNLGYLTASLVDLGTALRISVIAHLPALAISPDVTDFIKKLSQVGCSISGYFGGNYEVIGNLFKISNLLTLGRSEEDIVEEMQAICLNIIDEEKDARNKLKESDLLGIKDNVYRSFGLLKYAKILSYEESLELLSIIRLGIDLDIIDGVNNFDFFDLLNKISDSHIILSLEINEEITIDELESIRADLIRKKILKGIDLNV